MACAASHDATRGSRPRQLRRRRELSGMRRVSKVYIYRNGIGALLSRLELRLVLDYLSNVYELGSVRACSMTPERVIGYIL